MIIDDLPFPKRLYLSARYKLPEKLFLEQWIIPAGVTVVLITGRNFGLVSIPEGTIDVRGIIVPKQLFQY